MELKIILSVLVLFSLVFVLPSEAFADLGDITAVRAQSIGNHFEHEDGISILDNSLVQVNSDTFALAYRGPDNDGYIKTFTISSDGLTITEIENLKHDTTITQHHSLIQVDSDTYALAYSGNPSGGTWYGYISTFTIDSDGDITPIRIQNHAAFASASANIQPDVQGSEWNSLIHVNDDTYAVAFNGLWDRGYLVTLTISSDGSTITNLDKLISFGTGSCDCGNKSLVKVDSDTIALAHTGSGGDGYLVTFSIASNGDITKKSSLEFDDEESTYHSLVRVDSDTIALAHQGSTERNGFIKTFSINSSDSISQVESFEHVSTNSIKDSARYNSLANVDSDIYALAYSNKVSVYYGYISIFTINSDGNINAIKTQSQGNNLNHDERDEWNSLVNVDSNTIALSYSGTDADGYIATFTIDIVATEEVKKSSDCYDCEAPKLTKVEVHITSQNSDTQRISTSSEIWHFDQKSPYPMFGDTITPIVADPGDEVEIILELTDNRTLKRIADSGTYTNFLHKPNDMNNFYANNYDEYGKVSTTYYEWHQTGEDLFYDYDDTVEWSAADITIQESAEYVEGGQAPNLDGLVGTFSISFKMKFLQPMQTTDVWVQATDRSGNFFKVSLPLTLEISGNEPLLFESKVNQKVLSFYNESLLFELISDWTGSSQDVSELAAVLGMPDEQLPPWVTNLVVWVSEDRITIGDMIVSIEHLINN